VKGMNVPICPGCKLPMIKDGMWGPNGYGCVEGCGEWYWTAPDDHEGPEGIESTENTQRSEGRIGGSYE